MALVRRTQSWDFNNILLFGSFFSFTLSVAHPLTFIHVIFQITWKICHMLL